MEIFKQKELHTIFFGLRVHKPNLDESFVIMIVTIIAMLALNAAFPMPITWFIVGAVTMTAACLDMIDPKNKISSFFGGVIIGIAAGYLNFKILR